MVDYEEHFTDSRNFVVAFAGGHQNRFEWGNTLKRLHISHVLLRDTKQLYYQRGVDGLGDFRATLDYLRSIDATKRHVYIGVSSAAYAALLYGAQAPADEIIMISGLTGRELDGWEPEVHYMIRGPEDPEMEDIRHYYVDESGGRRPGRPMVHAFISDGPATALDGRMARRVLPDTLVCVPGYEHRFLARAMRDMGMIEELLK
jgi:hypothetical protein